MLVNNSPIAKLSTLNRCTVKDVLDWNKGETIHSMYRNHDYFGDGLVHDT